MFELAIPAQLTTAFIVATASMLLQLENAVHSISEMYKLRSAEEDNSGPHPQISHQKEKKTSFV